MSRQAQLMEVLKKEVRSLLMAAKEGLSPAQLEQEYEAMIGKPLPLGELGFLSTMELVAGMPEVVTVCPLGRDAVILRAVADESTKDIAKLISKQRTSVKARSAAPKANGFHSSKNQQRLPRRGRSPPVLPAAVKSELKDLLSSSPVLLSDFNRAFSRRFGRAFTYMHYGFFSMLEMLRSVSDIITIEQSRAGSLLTLKKNSTEEQQEKTLQAPAVEIPPPEPSCDTESFHQATEEKSEPEESQAVDCGDKLKQLEKDFKIMLCKKGAGETVSLALKEKIRTVVAKYPDGLPVSKLHREFEAHFKESLSVGKLGFVDMLEFVCSLHDVLHVEHREDEQDWLVFDLKSRCLTDVPPDKGAPCEEDSWGWSPPPPAEEVSRDSAPRKPEDVDLKQSPKFDVVTKSPPRALECSLLTTEVTTSEIPLDAVQSESLCCLPPLEGSCLVGVFVEFIISPSQFYIQVCGRETSDKLQDLMIEMRRCYSSKMVSDRYIMPESWVQPGQLCCVMISEDKWWYRVIIHRVLSEHVVEVFYADYGNLGTVQRSCLRFLKWCYLKLPAQAIPCSLAQVKPVEDTWTDAATLQFRRLCGSKLLVGVVDEYVDNILHLFLCDTSTEEDIYFHSVLESEGHAEFCRENIPSQGFQELNPLALYVQSSAKQENAGVLEPDLPFSRNPLQQESLGAKSGTASPRLHEGELCDQDEASLSPGMPYLEPVYAASDFWGKDKLPLQTVEEDTCVNGGTMGLDAAAFSIQSVSDEGQREKQPEPLQQEFHFSADEEIWDDIWPPLDEVDVPKTTDEEPELAKECTNENTPELMTMVKTPHSLGESSKSAVLSKSLEDVYISLIYSSQPAETNQEDPDQTERCSNKARLFEAVPASVLLLATPFILDQCNSKVKNEELPKTDAVVHGSAGRLADQETHQKLYVPPTSPSATLGAAARLAASSGLFQWFPSLRKEA